MVLIPTVVFVLCNVVGGFDVCKGSNVVVFGARFDKVDVSSGVSVVTHCSYPQTEVKLFVCGRTSYLNFVGKRGNFCFVRAVVAHRVNNFVV